MHDSDEEDDHMAGVSEAEEASEPEDGKKAKASKDDKEKVVKIRKNPLKPQPKLDAIRLSGDRGLKVLLDVFKDVKFKDTNSEFKNLDILMTRYKYWGHRLFPKMPFDEVIERVEKLGAKREVKFIADRIRYNQDPSKLEEELNQMNENRTNDDDDENDQDANEVIFRNAIPPHDSDEEDALLSTLNV